MDFEAILSKIMEMAGPMIQMAVELCMELVKGLMSSLGGGEGTGPSAKAGVAAALIGGAAMVGGAPADPNATVPAPPPAQVQPAAMAQRDPAPQLLQVTENPRNTPMRRWFSKQSKNPTQVDPLAERQ